MKRSQNDSRNVSRNDQVQQRAHRSRLRYDVNAQLSANIIATLPLAQRRVPPARERRQETESQRADARDRMIDSVLKALALTALASIAIGAVRWLARRPTALLLILAVLSVSALLAK